MSVESEITPEMEHLARRAVLNEIEDGGSDVYVPMPNANPYRSAQ